MVWRVFSLPPPHHDPSSTVCVSVYPPHSKRSSVVLHSNSVRRRCIFGRIPTRVHISSVPRPSLQTFTSHPGGVFTAKNISTNHNNNNNFEYYYDNHCTNRGVGRVWWWWWLSSRLRRLSRQRIMCTRAAVSLIKNITGSVMNLLVFIRPCGTVPVDVAHSATPSADFNSRRIWNILLYRVILWLTVRTQTASLCPSKLLKINIFRFVLIQIFSHTK